MAYTTINKSGDYFNTKLYTGNGSTSHTISGVGFEAGLTWIKGRNFTSSHHTIDQVRGGTKNIMPDNTGAEQSDNMINSWNSDGFNLNNYSEVNSNTNTFVAWNWKANGQGSANTDGSINTIYTSVNTTSGCSIVKYTGTGSVGTIGHGLGAVPKMIIIKDLGDTNNWQVYHASIGNTKWLELNTTSAEQTNVSRWNNTSPTSSVFTVGTTGSVNASGINNIAYCFAEKQGYSKFGSYIGNSNANGAFIYTGFKPAFVIIKRTSSAGDDWVMFDNKRSTSGKNVIDKRLNPNSSGAEQSGDKIDFLSNGFKCIGTTDDMNGNGSTYIYMAFGQSLVGSNNIPNNAR